jgi:uncharacterized protein with HEPN domain
MPYRDWKLRLEDVLEAIPRIDRYTAGMDYDSFRADDKTIDAVVRNLEVIGEAARHIPEEVQKQYPDIPWARMRDVRNVLIHEYFGVSVSIVWQTVRDDLPPLVPLLSKAIQQG